MRSSISRMKRPLLEVSLASLVLITTACSKDKEDAVVATPTTDIKYSQVSAFVTAYCAASGCHDAATKSGSFDATTRVGIAAKAAAAATRIESASDPMPPKDSDEKDSFDGETAGKADLLEWLKAGAPE